MPFGAAYKFALTSLMAVALLSGGQASVARTTGAPEALQPIALTELPPQGRDTYRLIRQGGPFPYEKDGTVFGIIARDAALGPLTGAPPLQPGEVRPWLHNIPCHHAAGLFIAGRNFGRPEWEKQARDFMQLIVGAQSEYGWWTEHRGPVVLYNRVYLEALGIGADGRWDECLAAWQATARPDLTSAAAHDIVWRSRGSKTPDLVVALIKQPGTTPAERARLLRSLDYVKGPQKDAALLQLLTP